MASLIVITLIPSSTFDGINCGGRALQSSNINGGDLKTTGWVARQIMSRAHWETVPGRTAILEKCAFDEAIRLTGDDRSLLASFDDDEPVIGIESKTCACKDEPFIEDEEERLDWLMWNRHGCLNR